MDPLYERAKAARTAGHITQTRLGKLIGATQSAISMFETGQPGKLSPAKIGLLAKELGIPLGPIEQTQHLVEGGFQHLI